MLGWQFDPRTRLDPQSRAGDRQARSDTSCGCWCKSRPELDVRLLIWKSPLLIAASQGFYPHKAQRWFRKRMVEFRLDSPGPIGACHHQKVVVIDDPSPSAGRRRLGGSLGLARTSGPRSPALHAVGADQRAAS
jgi:hypothetical protein